MASDEEEDYMSDAILAQCQDKRPGLLSRTKAKQYANEKKIKITNVKNQIKPRKVLENESREKGLETEIGSENKGFALLSKMGYKPGMAIGKQGQGRAEPISIEVKAGRSGLGHDQAVKRRQETMASMRAVMMQKRVKYEESSRQDYRSRLSEQMTEKETEKDLYKSQKVCEHLDTDEGWKEPAEKYFWPPKIRQKNNLLDEEDEESEEEEVEEDLLPPAEKLEAITEYLRKTYNYCTWCGTKFDDSKDLETNCPGDNADAHR